jgi:hypothetical protein
MLQSNDTRVVSFYNDVTSRKRDSAGRLIGSSKSTTGYLYVTGGKRSAVQVVLPMNLIDYANASSGVMGDSTSGVRPVGIRAGHFDSAEDAADYVSKIFSSPDELARFINDSECDAVYTAGGSRTPRPVIITDPLNAPVKTMNLNAVYGSGTMQTLMAKYSKTVRDDFANLTVREFQERYALTPTA